MAAQTSGCLKFGDSRPLNTDAFSNHPAHFTNLGQTPLTRHVPDFPSFAPRSIQLPAVLQTDGHAPFFGTIVTLSDQGLGFDLLDNVAPQLAIGSKARLDFDFQGRHYTCHPMLVHVQGCRTLLSLRETPANVIAALHAVNRQNVPHLASSLAILQKQQACHAQFMSSMADVVSRFYQMLSGESGNGGKSGVPAALRHGLASLRPVLTRQFTQAYPMYPELRASYSERRKGNEALEVVDMDRVDDWIRRSGIAHQVSEALHPLPDVLTRHYAKLLRLGEQPVQHPYLPESVLDTLADLIAPLSLEAEQRVWCYELMGKALQQEAVPLYQALLQIIGDVPEEAAPAPGESADLAQWLKASSQRPGSVESAGPPAGDSATIPIDALAALIARLTENLDFLREQQHLVSATDLQPATQTLIPGMLARDRIMDRFLSPALADGPPQDGGLSGGLVGFAGPANLDSAALENLYALLLQPPPIDPGPEKISPASQVRTLMLQAQGLLLEYSLNGLTYQARPDHPAWALINALDALHRGADDRGQFFDPALHKATSLAMQWLLGQENTDAALEQVNALLAKIDAQLLVEQQARRANHLDALGEAEGDPSPIGTRWCVVKQETDAIPYEVLGKFAGSWALLNRSATQRLEIPAARFVEDVDAGLIEEAGSFDAPFLERIATATLTASLNAVHSYTWQDPGSGCLKRTAMMDELERRLAHPVSEPPSFCALIEIPSMRPGLSSLPADELAVMQQRTGEILHEFLQAGEQCGRLSDVSFLLMLAPQEPGLLAERLACLKNDMERLHEAWKMIGAVVPLVDADGPATPSSVLRRANLACAPLRQQAGFDLSCLSKVPEGGNRITPLPFDSLFLRCQKISSCHDGAPSHYEILLGIQEDPESRHTTQSFVAMAEQTGRSQDLDAWVLKATLEWMDRNPDAVERLSGLSINLSGNSLVQDLHVDAMAQLLSEYSHLTSKLILEVTETAAISNLDLAVRSLRKLRRLGCRVALDDFGSGYSSYGYLRNLPLDYLKIDGIYIRNILTDKTDQALTASMVDVAHALGLKVIAEYVDSEAVYAWLKELGVDYVQGYWVHEPERLDTLTLH
jgi:EAL domain-containing protein (putative c-di-GMP-specific phosphodiesterase class I)